MKPRQVQSSCSCTSCLNGSESESPSSRQLAKATKIERLFYDQYLPLRQRKLVEKLIKTRAVYDDVRNQILSRSNVNVRGDSPFDDVDDVEKSSALLEIVSLVDKGDGINPKLSQCCSCCTCGSKSELHNRRNRHVKHHHARGSSLSWQSGAISKRREKEGQRYRSRGVQFKHIRSDPCTCTLKFFSKQKLLRTSQKRDSLELLGNEGVERATSLLSKVEERARKSVKKIQHTKSKIKSQCQCIQGKSIEKLKQAKYSMKEKLDAMQTHYVKRHETEHTVAVDELGKKVKKDSITKFREKLEQRKLEREFECEPECSEEVCVPEDCLEELNLRRSRRQKRDRHHLKTSLETGTEEELKRKIITEKGLQSPPINIKIGSKATKKAAIGLCSCKNSLKKSINSSVKLITSKSKSSSHFISTSVDKLKNVSYRKRKLDRKMRGKKRRSGANTRYQSASSGTSQSVSIIRKQTPRVVRAEQSAPNVAESTKLTGTSKQMKLKLNKSMLCLCKATKKSDRRSQVTAGNSNYTSRKYGLRRCFCTLKLTQSQKVKSRVKKGKEISNQTISQHVTSTSAETNTSKVTSLLPSECECSAILKKLQNNVEERQTRHQSTGNRIVVEPRSSFTSHTSSKVLSLLPYECEPGVCIPEKCDPYQCLDIINKRKNNRDRNRRHKALGKRVILESQSSFTPTATPHRAKKVQSSMFAYKTEVQTQYNNNKYSPEEANRIQEIPRLSGLPMVKISSSFSFNIEFFKGLPPLPISEDTDDITRPIYEPQRTEPIIEDRIIKETKTQKSILKNKNKAPKKVNKGTHATTKSSNRIKCMCRKLQRKPKERPVVNYVSTSTETNLPPVNVTKATETKKIKASRKIVVGPYECEPHICVPGLCSPYECLEIIKRRNQQFSKETGTTVDQRRRKTSSSFTDNVKTSEKAVPVKTRAVNQPTIVFNKEARRPAVIKTTSKENRQPIRQAVKIGSSLNFSIEFSRNRLPDPESFVKPLKEKSIQSFENNDKKFKSVDKHYRENRLKRCFCTLKLKNQKVSNVFAINKFILDKNQSHQKRSVVYSTNQSQINFAGSSCDFNFKDMQSYFNENKHKGCSFHGRNGGSCVDMLKEVNLNDCFTFSEARCLKGNTKLTTTNRNEDWISYKSFSTSFSKSDVTGVSPLLKRCFCTLNIRVQDMDNAVRRHKLRPYECEPGICIPGECNPYECQKLIQKRLMRKSSKISGVSIAAKSISSNTFRQAPHVRETRLQANSQGENRPRQRRGKPTSGIQYKSLPNKSHKQAVRVGSTFSFNIEFCKDKMRTKEDHRLVVEKKPLHMRSKPVGAILRAHRTEGTSYGTGTSDRHLQSRIRTRDMQSNTDKMLKRCFCTLKLQKTEKERQYHDRSNYVAMKEIRKTPSTSTTAQNTRAFKSERPRRILDPNECKPGTCVPGQCNPYECLEKIKMRYKNTRELGSGLGQPQRRSISSITNKQKPRKIGRSVQSRFREKPLKSTISTVTYSDLPSGKRSGKSLGKSSAVRIGSSYSFNIEFFKNNISPETRPEKITYSKSKIRTSNKSIGYLRTNVRGRGAQDSRAIHQKDLQASTLSRMKSTMTTSFLKRCFCTAKLQGIKNVPSISIQPPPRTEVEKIQTDKIKTRAPKVIPEKLESYECPPGICVPGPGECDPYACLRKVNRRHKLLGSDMARSKSSYSNFKPLKERKGRKVQHNKDHRRPGDIKRPRDTKGLRSYPPTNIKRPRDSKLLRGYPTNISEIKTIPSISGDSKRKQAVRIGSTFSFNIEFYKDKSPNYEEIQTAAKKLKHKSQKLGSKENKRHRGSDGLNTKMLNQISQVSKTMTDRSMSTIPKRCFCTLKLQKRSQFNAEKYEKKVPPSAINRGIMTRNKQGKENPLEKKQIPNKLEPYECEPGVCIPGECDPNECLLRIQKRNMKESGTTTRYLGGRSVSSLASMASTVSHRVQYGSKPPKTTESAKIRSHRPRVRKYRQIPLKQVVRIGSSYSFNVEFFKDRSYNENNPRTKVMRMHENKYKATDKMSWQTIGSKPQGSQDSELVHQKDSQSIIPKMRSSMTDAQFLKRCYCTLKLQKSNRTLNLPMNMRNQKVYLATLHNLSPYECEPGFCIPYECDPYECEKRIRQRMKQSKLTGMQKSSVRSSSSNAAGVLNQTKSSQGEPWTRAKGISSTRLKKIKPPYLSEKHRHNDTNHRQAVRIGSNFSFNIEFFKDKPSFESQGDQVLKKRYIPNKSKTAITHYGKGKHMYSQIDDPRGKHMYSQIGVPRGRHMYSQMDPRSKDVVSQVDMANTQSRGAGQLHKSCFCTLKLQKLGKHEREILQKGRLIQTSKSFKPPTRYMTQGSVGTSTSKKVKKDKMDIMDMAAKTQTKKLLPYECEPGVCTQGLCDPYECLERIKRRELRNFGTSTGKNMRERYVDVGNKTKNLNTGQQMRDKMKKTTYTTSRQRLHTPSYIAVKNENIRNSTPGRQAVRIGSSFSFNIEFYKDKPHAVKDLQLDREPEFRDTLSSKSKNIRTEKGNIFRPEKKYYKEEMVGPGKRNAQICTASKVCDTVTRFQCSKECQNCPNTECKSTGMGPLLKRCFCTLKLQRPYDKSRLERYGDNAPMTGIKLANALDKKTATKRFKPLKPIEEQHRRTQLDFKPLKPIDEQHKRTQLDLLPYECEPGFCTPGQCDPYVCLERIKQRNMTKKIGTNLYPSQKSVTSGYCPGQYCTESCQTDMRPRSRNEYLQQTDSTVEEPRFQKAFGGQQGVKYGSNFSFNIEFYKEQLAPDFSKIKADVPSDDNIGRYIPTHNQTQYFKPKKDTKQTYANKKFHTTANTQSEGIKLENKGTGVINTLKRCFCTLNLQKGALDKEKIVTVNRVAIEDNRGPFSNFVRDYLKENPFGNTSIVYRTDNIREKFNKKRREGGKTQVIYPYVPKKFNKNVSKTLLRYENNCLPKSCLRLKPRNIWPTLTTNGKRVRRLTAKHSEHSLKVNTPEYLNTSILRNKSSLSKLSGLRSVIDRCKQIFSKRIKDINMSVTLENNSTSNKHSQVGKYKSVLLPIENKKHQHPKFSAEISDSTKIKKYLNKFGESEKIKSEKALLNTAQPPRERSFNNKIICSYCQIQYEKDKMKPANFSLVIRPNQNFLTKGQNNTFKILDNKLGSTKEKQTNGCDCVSMCKCENCTGDWRTMLAEKREARRLEYKKTVIGKCMNVFKTNMFKKKEPFLKPKEEKEEPELQHDICARCCKNINHIDPKSLCQGIERMKKKVKASVSIKGMPTDVSTDICTCESPCPCERCHRNATFSELCDDRISPQKFLLISDINLQTKVTEACICENINKNDTKPNNSNLNRSCTCMPCPYPNSPTYLKSKTGTTNTDANEAVPIKVPESGQISLNKVITTKKKQGLASKMTFLSMIKNVYKTKPYQRNCSVSCPRKMSRFCQNLKCDIYQTVGTEIDNIIKRSDKNETAKQDNNLQIYNTIHNKIKEGQNNTKKYDEKKPKLDKKKQKLERKKHKHEAKKLEQEYVEKTTQMNKLPGDLCSCKFPCPCETKPTQVNVNEFSCNDDVLPQKYVFLRDVPQNGKDDVINIGHETTKKQNLKKRKRDPKKIQKIKHDQTTQVLKHLDDLCSCKFPCPCQRSPDKVNVNEFSCDNNVLPQKYILLSDAPENIQLYNTLEYDAKKEKLEKKRLKNERKQQKLQDLKRKKEERETELEAQRQKREMEKLVKITQTQKPPGDLCSCKFPCSCERSPDTVNVKEFSCDDNVLPQKYLLISDSPQIGGQLRESLNNVGHDIAQNYAKKQKIDKKGQEKKRKKKEREALKQKREMEKIGKITQTHKAPGDLCFCKFPCSCNRTPENVVVKEFSCNDNVLPQKYLFINDSPEPGYSQGGDLNKVGHDTAQISAKKQKLNRKKQHNERKKEEREAKHQERDKGKQDQATQMHKHPNDLCTCRFPCPCHKTRKNVTVAELACNDWPSPQKYLLLSDMCENDDFDVSEVGHDILKQDKKKQKVGLKKLNHDTKKQDTEKQKRNKETQIRKHSNDLCTCNFPCSCQKPQEKLKISELACNDWPSPQRYLLLSEISKKDMLETDQRPLGANQVDALKGIQIYIKDNQFKAFESNEVNANEKKINTLQGMHLNSQANQVDAFVEFHINTDVSQNVVDDELLKGDSRNLQGGDDSLVIKRDSKKLKSDKKKEKRENKKQKLISRNQIHKHRSELCTCKTPCSCQKSTKNVSEFSCGDSTIPQKYLIQGDQINVSKTCQATNSKECQIHQYSADVARNSDNRREKQIIHKKHKHRSNLCTCKFPYPCEKCAKEINTSEFSGGDWPIPQKRLFVTGGHQTSNLPISQIDISNDRGKVAAEICQFDSPIYDKHKTKMQRENGPKHSKKSKQEKIQQTPKDRDDLCICPFPCTCQKCPKTLDVTEFSLDDWPSPRRCLFVDDNDRIKRGNVGITTSDTNKYRTGAKFEYYPNKVKKIKSVERGSKKVSKFFVKAEKHKRTNFKDQLEEVENVRDAGKKKHTVQEQWKEVKNLQGDAGMTKETGKEQWKEAENIEGDLGNTNKTAKAGKTIENKKKIKKKKLLAIEDETQTQMVSGGADLQKSNSVTSRATKVVAQVKSISNKLKIVSKKLGKKCICGVPECKKELMALRHKKKEKIIPDKKCTCGVPTCEEKTKTFKAMMLKETKSLKSVPVSEFKSKSKKSKKSKLVPEYKSESEHKKSNKSKKSKFVSDLDIENKLKKSKKTKKSKLESESDLDIKNKQKKSKKMKNSKLEPEIGSDTVLKRKRSKKSNRTPEPETKSKSKKSKPLPVSPGSKSKKSKLQSEAAFKTKRSFLVSRAECLCSHKRSPLATCLCDHTCLCASEEAKAKAKAKQKPKTKAKSKKPKKKPVKKPKKPVKKPKKPTPGPFARCIKSINKSCERRRRRAARRRNTKKALKHVKKCARSFGKSVDQIKTNVASTQAMKSITNTLEQHYVSNFILHARDPKKRFNPRKKKGKEPMDFECSLFMGSLRRRPWLSVYYMCPWFYPHCISCLNIWKQFTDVILFLLAVGVWSPCILAIEICRAFVCCAFCTG